MTPFLADPDFTLYQGDVLEALAGLPDESVHCCVTSPPYWGLRDYQTGTWDGGDPDCDHLPGAAPRASRPAGGLTGGTATVDAGNIVRDRCACGATRVDQQLGLEPTPEAYVARMVAVFREVRRVLRHDGTCWLNIGDSYASKPPGIKTAERYKTSTIGAPPGLRRGVLASETAGKLDTTQIPGIKEKDLVGIPWMLAFALRADGWCLRSEVIWAKPNPMPESVTDRPTKAHEQVFLLTPCKWVGAVEPWPMRREDAIWLAAIVDGEGTVCFQERQNQEWAPHVGIRLSIVNTNRALLERVAAITNIAEGTTPSPRRRNDGAPGRPVFAWQVTNEKAARIIAAIRPYLVAKQDQAELAIYVHTLNQKHKGRGGHRTTDADLDLKRKAAAACSALNHGEDVDLGWFKPVKPGRWVPPRTTFYDADAIREPSLRAGDIPGGSNERGRGEFGVSPHAAFNGPVPVARNARSVWEIATQPYPEAHFATFPEELPRRCIAAGTSERGCCPACGAPWERVVERGENPHPGSSHDHTADLVGPGAQRHASGVPAGTIMRQRHEQRQAAATVCWRPTCDHALAPVPCTVLDPFMGSATTALVARKLGRRSIGIELNPDYCQLAARRLSQLSLLAEAAS